MKPMKKLIASLSVMASLALAAPQATAGAVYHHWSETPTEVQAAHSPEVLQSYIDAYWVNEWTNAYWFNRWMEAAAAKAAVVPPCTGPGHSRCSVQGIEVCNGNDLPTCGVVWRESRFNPTARNPRSSAGGLYQHLRAWAATCGIPVSNMAYASVAQQAQCARYVWNGGVNSNGLGPRHWSLTL